MTLARRREHNVSGIPVSVVVSTHAFLLDVRNTIARYMLLRAPAALLLSFLRWPYDSRSCYSRCYYLREEQPLARSANFARSLRDTMDASCAGAIGAGAIDRDEYVCARPADFRYCW